MPRFQSQQIWFSWYEVCGLNILDYYILTIDFSVYPEFKTTVLNTGLYKTT